MKKRKILIILGVIFATVAILVWNSPGVKSRRLGRRCQKKYVNWLRTAETDQDKEFFLTGKELCLTNIARKYQNYQLCDWIERDMFKRLCYDEVDYWDKSVEYCESSEDKDMCLYVVSKKRGDKSICRMIDSEELRETCLQRFKEESR